MRDSRVPQARGVEPLLLVDTSQWPIVVLTFEGSPSNGQVVDHLKEVEEKVLARRRPFVQIVDQRRGLMPSASQRALISEHQARMAPLYAEYCLGEAYVASRELRGAMRAVFWLAPPSYPHAFLDTLDEAFAWAGERLRGAASQRPASQTV